MSGINQRRLEMVDAITSSGCEAGCHDVVSAMVLPLAEQLVDPARDNHYERFLAQAVADPCVDSG